MKKLLGLLLIPVAAVLLSAAARADDQAIYKWTDAQGVLHYSDKPPKESAADLHTLDLPPLPPQDPAKIATAEAAQAAGTTALLRELQAETLLQQQQAALATQQAELQAALDAQQQPDGADVEAAPVYPLYADSPLIPRAYRRNLYLHHRVQPRAPLTVARPASLKASVPMNARP